MAYSESTAEWHATFKNKCWTGTHLSSANLTNPVWDVFMASGTCDKQVWCLNSVPPASHDGLEDIQPYSMPPWQYKQI
jgi:hypothetical protein